MLVLLYCRDSLGKLGKAVFPEARRCVRVYSMCLTGKETVTEAYVTSVSCGASLRRHSFSLWLRFSFWEEGLPSLPQIKVAACLAKPICFRLSVVTVRCAESVFVTEQSMHVTVLQSSQESWVRLSLTANLEQRNCTLSLTAELPWRGWGVTLLLLLIPYLNQQGLKKYINLRHWCDSRSLYCSLTQTW